MPATESVAFEAFLSGIGNKDRQNIQRHLTAVDAEAGPAHGRLWRRLAVTLRKLAPLAVQTVAQQAVQFFVADGKYRMQVFTLEDKRDGMLQVYLPDVLDAAFRAKILAKPSKRAATASTRSKPSNGIPLGGPLDAPAGVIAVEYPITAKAGESLRIEALDNHNSPEPPPHVRHMLGWNRKALRITLSANGSPAQAAAVEALCELAAKSWAESAATTK
jgi:hypothetical protein